MTIKTCPQCHQAFSTDDNFCMNCGVKLVASHSTPKPASRPTPSYKKQEIKRRKKQKPAPSIQRPLPFKPIEKISVSNHPNSHQTLRLQKQQDNLAKKVKQLSSHPHLFNNRLRSLERTVTDLFHDRKKITPNHADKRFKRIEKQILVTQKPPSSISEKRLEKIEKQLSSLQNTFSDSSHALTRLQGQAHKTIPKKDISPLSMTLEKQQTKIRRLEERINDLNTTNLSRLQRLEKSLSTHIPHKEPSPDILKILNRRISQLETPDMSRIDALEKRLASPNTVQDIKPLEKRITQLEKNLPKSTSSPTQKKELDQGMLIIRGYITENEKAIDDIEKKLRTIPTRNDIKALREKSLIEKEQILQLFNNLKKVGASLESFDKEKNAIKNDIRHIKETVVKDQKEKITDWDRKVREDLKEIRIQNKRLSAALTEKVNKSVDENIRKMNDLAQRNAKEIVKVSSLMSALQKKKSPASQKEMQQLETLQQELDIRLKRSKEWEREAALVLKELENRLTVLDTYVGTLKKKKPIDIASQKMQTVSSLHSIQIKKLQDQVKFLQVTLYGKNKKTVENTVKDLLMNDRVLTKKIHAILGHESQTMTKTIADVLRSERDYVEKTRQAMMKRMEAELDKLGSLRKSTRDASQQEIEKMEHIRKTMQDAFQQELQTIKEMKKHAREDIQSAQKRLHLMDNVVAKEVTHLKQEIRDAVERQVTKHLHEFQKTATETERKVDSIKHLMRNMEKRLTTDLINTSQKISTLSRIQTEHEMTAVTPKKQLQQQMHALMKNERGAVMKMMEEYVKQTMDGFIVPEKQSMEHLISMVTELKEKVDGMEQSTKNIVKTIKDEVVRKAIIELEKEF